MFSHLMFTKSSSARRCKTRWRGDVFSQFSRGSALCVVLVVFAALSADAFPADVRAYFCDDCEKIVCCEIQDAKKTILVAAFALTSNYVVDALVEARKRGVEVRVKIDREQSEMKAAKRLIGRLRMDKISVHTIGMAEYYSMHNKFLVIDEHTVLTGSFNFTIAAARENWENIVVIESPPVASAFRKEWDAIKTRKKPLHGK